MSASLNGVSFLHISRAHELYGRQCADTCGRPGKQMLLARMWTWPEAEYLFIGCRAVLCTRFALDCLITYDKGWTVYSNRKYRFSKWIFLRIHNSLAFCLFITDNDVSLQRQFCYRKTNNTPQNYLIFLPSSSCFYELGSPSCLSS
jgi:hypothetical protein